MRVGRTCPELNASLFFAADEIHGAHVLCKKARPKKPPTLNQMIRMVGSLGGFLGRKSDGEPGAKTLWIGMQRVMDAVIRLFLSIPRKVKISPSSVTVVADVQSVNPTSGLGFRGFSGAGRVGKWHSGGVQQECLRLCELS
jgi:hypothetical protein